MNKFIYKVASAGGGKTRWLLENAYNMAFNENKNVYLFTDNQGEYSRFCEKFITHFNRVCPVEVISFNNMHLEDAIILVDNLLDQNVTALQLLSKWAHDCVFFVTVDGETEQKTPEAASTEEHIQLSLFDCLSDSKPEVEELIN